MEERLGEIARGLREVIARAVAAVVAVEDVFTHIRTRAVALALAQARGMVLAVVGLAGLPVASYRRRCVKKAVAGSGRADKDQVARMVQALIGLRSCRAPTRPTRSPSRSRTAARCGRRRRARSVRRA